MNRFFLALAGCIMLVCKMYGQSVPGISLKKVKNKLYFLYFDSTNEKKYMTKGTLVEFRDFIALVEMPIGDNGSNQKERKDLVEGGAALSAFLKKEFPKKPLKYILSTHWHEHSLSSVLPFIKTGTSVVTTKNNFKYLEGMLEGMPEAEYKKHFIFVEDSIVIQDKGNKIIGYRFTKDDYPSVPTNDYIFYHMPAYNIMNISCMYHRYNGYSINGKEVVYGRTEDLYKFLKYHQLKPAYVIRTFGDMKDPNDMIEYDTVEEIMSTGITETEIKDEMINTVLVVHPDSFVKTIINRKIGGGLVNSAVYAALRKKKLEEALALARVLCLMYPDVTGYWDTYGEAYYFIGEKELAERYDRLCRKMQKDFSAGKVVWQQHLEEYSDYWEQNHL